MEPGKEKIEQIKLQYPDRVLFQVNAVAVEASDKSEEQIMTFLMTGPTRDEYKFFINKMIAAREMKDESDKLWAVRTAVENAAIAQIRWPDREEVKKAFDARPEMIDGFAAELQKAAGSNVELRSKKL